MGYFQFLAITNEGALSIHIQVVIWTYTFISIEYLEKEWFGHMIGTCLEMPDSFAK